MRNWTQGRKKNTYAQEEQGKEKEKESEEKDGPREERKEGQGHVLGPEMLYSGLEMTGKKKV